VALAAFVETPDGVAWLRTVRVAAHGCIADSPPQLSSPARRWHDRRRAPLRPIPSAVVRAGARTYALAGATRATTTASA
jgi:hypothetical protein